MKVMIYNNRLEPINYVNLPIDIDAPVTKWDVQVKLPSKDDKPRNVFATDDLYIITVYKDMFRVDNSIVKLLYVMDSDVQYVMSLPSVLLPAQEKDYGQHRS